MPYVDKKEHRFVYNYETERLKRMLAVFLLLLASILFCFTIVGFIDEVSDFISDFLASNLGYTNKWSTTYGPQWFVNMNSNISALGGSVLLFIFLILIVFYYSLKKEQKIMWRFVSIVFGGGIILLTLKIIFAEKLPYESSEFITNSISPFPSGHAMISLIFYLPLAVFKSRRYRNKKLVSFFIISACALILLIGISLVLKGTHIFKEVLAGWSAGMIWLCLCWFLERYVKRNRQMT